METLNANRPTIIVGFDPDEGVFGVTLEGFDDVDTSQVRVIVRDWSKGNEPDENGDLYEDTEL